MENNDLDELSKLLEERDDKHAAEETEAQRQSAAMKRKAIEFDEIKLNKILPVMEEVGGFLKSKGHDYFISGKEKFDTSAGYSNKQGIGFQIRLLGKGGKVPYPHSSPTLDFFVLIMDENSEVTISEQNVDSGRTGVSNTVTVDVAKLDEPGFISGRIMDFTKKVITSKS